MLVLCFRSFGAGGLKHLVFLSFLHNFVHVMCFIIRMVISTRMDVSFVLHLLKGNKRSSSRKYTVQ